ncbi:uncharacterized protein PHACADRAFT_265225 [Phanerochaete carnosa HHB-10118-sp]|uniref:Uncharacterized protein n=1 Tax=Phanerochaete carnosa (strain HHB-10118-sp) TaxID=650164 RepID=K5WHF8_PHACS|nr:uncharacterized protein PHACADRAFT_265225 [Phanerochaete carnosa HHB-10118-sp]EKM49657.1 hypothetical protein PHACADRAFT_265225 [Phanerochaete carnosa HHB-10118-sp]
MAALTRDEEQIMRLLSNMSDADRCDIVCLRGPHAADLLNLLDLVRLSHAIYALITE